MCISAGASFGASAVLFTAGAIALKKTKTRSSIAFASIPLFFAIQQFIEGFMWITLTNPKYYSLQALPTYGFLFFALIVWPTLVPLSVYLMEKSKKLKKIQIIFLIIGIFISIFMTVTMLFYNVNARVLSFHVHYDIEYPVELPYITSLIYFIPTAIPLFVSSVKRMKYFGFTIVLSFLVTNIYFKENLVSIWCFFAAIMSTIILTIMWDLNKMEKEYNVKCT